jgi:hypothetical protein
MDSLSIIYLWIYKLPRWGSEMVCKVITTTTTVIIMIIIIYNNNHHHHNRRKLITRGGAACDALAKWLVVSHVSQRWSENVPETFDPS